MSQDVNKFLSFFFCLFHSISAAYNVRLARRYRKKRALLKEPTRKGEKDRVIQTCGVTPRPNDRRSDFVHEKEYANVRCEMCVEYTYASP